MQEIDGRCGVDLVRRHRRLRRRLPWLQRLGSRARSSDLLVRRAAARRAIAFLGAELLPVAASADRAIVASGPAEACVLGRFRDQHVAIRDTFAMLDGYVARPWDLDVAATLDGLYAMLAVHLRAEEELLLPRLSLSGPTHPSTSERHRPRVRRHTPDARLHVSVASFEEAVRAVIADLDPMLETMLALAVPASREPHGVTAPIAGGLRPVLVTDELLMVVGELWLSAPHGQIYELGVEATLTRSSPRTSSAATIEVDGSLLEASVGSVVLQSGAVWTALVVRTLADLLVAAARHRPR